MTIYLTMDEVQELVNKDLKEIEQEVMALLEA